MSDVFQALYEHWKRVKNPAKKQQLSRILLESKLKAAEIDIVRAERQRMREQDRRRSDRQAMMEVSTLHELEAQACRELCPQLKTGKGSVKTLGWEWVMNQPWAQEFKCPPIEKQFY